MDIVCIHDGDPIQNIQHAHGIVRCELSVGQQFHQMGMKVRVSQDSHTLEAFSGHGRHALKTVDGERYLLDHITATPFGGFGRRL